MVTGKDIRSKRIERDLKLSEVSFATGTKIVDLCSMENDRIPVSNEMKKFFGFTVDNESNKDLIKRLFDKHSGDSFESDCAPYKVLTDDGFEAAAMELIEEVEIRIKNKFIEMLDPGNGTTGDEILKQMEEKDKEIMAEMDAIDGMLK